MLTLNATGRVLLDLQWLGKTEQTKFGDPVLTNSPGCSVNAFAGNRSPAYNSVNAPDLDLDLNLDVDLPVLGRQHL